MCKGKKIFWKESYIKETKIFISGRINNVMKEKKTQWPKIGKITV